MIKGSVVLKPSSYGRWVRIFKEWISSGYAAIVIHCLNRDQLRAVQKSAANFRTRTGSTFWTHADGTDLYLIRPDPIKEIAMEVEDRKDGTVYFYDSAKTV